MKVEVNGIKRPVYSHSPWNLTSFAKTLGDNFQCLAVQSSLGLLLQSFIFCFIFCLLYLFRLLCCLVFTLTWRSLFMLISVKRPLYHPSFNVGKKSKKGENFKGVEYIFIGTVISISQQINLLLIWKQKNLSLFNVYKLTCDIYRCNQLNI